ncbi:nitrate reductase [Thiomicrorhabdus aquaedulcis]|uniref:nitrate reductase n=1 Tax=Thiomicrorhabdus aquaedulcis TaxID=2211106 RepID=UPI000FDA1B95|nr:nitrate reductase [Thiomicrorhabdus aquaedulcis]
MTTANKVTETTCPYCGVGCGMRITPSASNVSSTPDSEATFSVDAFSVVGSPSHPANFGKLCVKGSSVTETLGFAGRMLAPQINAKPVDWDNALRHVADTLKRVIAEHGREAVAFYVSGQLLTEDYYVANKLMKGFIGAANIDTNSRLCMASAVVGYKRAFGADAVPCSYEDLEHAELITLVGSNTAWAHPIVYQRIAAAKKANPRLKVVVIDPRKTATCEIADLHLALKPGSDAALFNGLLAYLHQHNGLDDAYIAQHTQGFEAALASAQALESLHEVAAWCDLDASALEQWFKWALQTPKMVTLYSQGVNQSSSGVDKSNAIINVHLATGRIGKEGTGPFSITGQPNAMGGREVGGLANQLAAHMDFATPGAIDRVQRFWQAPNMARSNGLKAVEMFDAVAQGHIKAIWIINTNPVVSMPDADAVKAALQGCECVIVQDCLQHTDTTAVGTVLLPALTWGETSGSVTNSDRTISMQRQFMQGPEHARADWWIVCEVAKRMGWSDAFSYASEADIFREHAALSGFENDDLHGRRDFDLSGLVNLSDADYADFSPKPWPINAAHPNGCKRLFSDGRFFTPSGRAQFIAITPRLPHAVLSADWPLRLNTGRVRDQWHTMTRTGKTPRLLAHRGEPFVSLHPSDAAARGIVAGDWVRVFNPLGQYMGRAELSEQQRVNEVFAPIHWTAQNSAHGRVDALIPAVVDPLSGQPELKHAAVQVARLQSDWQGFVLSRTPLPAALLSDLVSWVSVQGDPFYRYEVVGRGRLDALPSALAALPSVCSSGQNTLNNGVDAVEFLEYHAPGLGQTRAAWLVKGALQQVVFLAATPSPSPSLPSRDWLGRLFANATLTPSDRFALLAGYGRNTPDPGAQVCACFGVGVNTLVSAIQSQKLTTVAQIGAHCKAGTNCGSCVPELTELLRQMH